MMGCGCEDQEEGVRLCTDALGPRDDLDTFLDPRPYLGAVRGPIVLVHGREDDVIPYTQLEALHRAFSPGASVRAFLTGLYGHTGGVRRMSGLFREEPQFWSLSGTT